MKNYEFVIIKWVDSYGCGSNWAEMPEHTVEAHYCYSAGWLVRDSDEFIVVVPHISPANKKIGSEEMGCGDMAIPKASIIKKETIKTCGRW